MQQNILFNGKFLPEDEKTVTIYDRSFRYGDGAFETLSIYGRRIYQEAFHRQRLVAALAALKIYGVDIDTAFAGVYELIARNGVDIGFSRIAVSRGEGGAGYLPPENPVPSVVISTRERSNNHPESASLWVSSITRPPLSSLPNCKTANGLNSILARIEATENGCFEALQLDIHGNIAEASSANIFWTKGGRLYTSSLATGALPGAIREAILRLHKVEQGLYPLTTLLSADEIFLTNVSWVVMPVSGISQKSEAGSQNFEPLRGAVMSAVIRALNEDIRQQCGI